MFDVSRLVFADGTRLRNCAFVGINSRNQRRIQIDFAGMRYNLAATHRCSETSRGEVPVK
jgi:hypothetical protein